MKKLLTGLALLCLTAGSAQADLTNYSQDFEGMATAESGADPSALDNDGWQGFATNYVGAVGDRSTFNFNYGTFPAPNGGPGFSGVEDNVSQGDDGTGPQGTRHLNIYSDYNERVAHDGTTHWLDAIVFQDNGIVGAGDVGNTWTFEFDYKANNEINPNTGNPFGPGGETNAFAFVKVLEASNGSFGTLAEFEVETTNADLNNWTSGQIDVVIDGAWAGELLQFGFRTEAQNDDPSGVLYDNLSFSAVPEPTSAALFGIGLVGLAIRRRRSA